MTTPATENLDINPPADIQPAIGGETTIIPPAHVIERLRMIANDLAGAKAGIGKCHNAGTFFYKMLLGWENGIRPATALSAIDIIEGKGCLTAQTLSATIEARGLGKIRLAAVDDDGATIEVTRPGWRPGTVEIVTYTKYDAAQAGFLTLDTSGAIVKDKNGAPVSSKKNWRTNHQDMFVARARGRAHRRHFDVASLGLPYAAEELEDLADATPRVELENPAPSWQKPTAAEQPTAEPKPEPEADATPTTTPPPAEPVITDPIHNALIEGFEERTATATPEQLAKATELVKALKIPQVAWKTLLARYGVKDSLKAADRTQADRIIKHLAKIRLIGQLRAEVKVSDDQWKIALTKRGITLDIDLSEADADAIIKKMADRVSPFRRQELGLDPATEGSLAPNPSAPPASLAA